MIAVNITETRTLYIEVIGSYFRPWGHTLVLHWFTMLQKINLVTDADDLHTLLFKSEGVSII